MDESDEFVYVAMLNEVPPGTLKQVDVDGTVVVVGNDGGNIFALGGRCSHEGTELRLGTLADHVLTCFAHQWTYNVRTGDPIWPPIAKIAPGYRLRTYRVEVRGEAVVISRKPSRLGLN